MAKNKEKTEDKIVAVEEALGRGEQFIEKNKNLLFYILLGILVVIGGYFGYKKYISAPKEREAQAKMFPAEQYFAMDSVKYAINGDGQNPGFQEIIDEYGSTKSGNLARYYLGICYLKTGKFQDAIDCLEDFKSDDMFVGPLALGAIGDAYMELGNTDKAIDYYIKAADKNDNNLTAPMFLKRAGQSYEMLNNYAKAVEMYTRVQKEHFRSTEGRDIEKYIARAKELGNIK